MKFKRGWVIFILFFISLTTPMVHAKQNDKGFSISRGVFKFTQQQQTIRKITDENRDCNWIYITCGYDFTYVDVTLKLSDQYKNSISIQYEQDVLTDFTINIRFSYLQSDYKLLNATTSGKGKIRLASTTVGMRYNFNARGLLQPYLGLDIGTTHANLSGVVDENFYNIIGQANIGISANVANSRITLSILNSKAIYQHWTSQNNNSSKINKHAGRLNLTGNSINFSIMHKF